MIFYLAGPMNGIPDYNIPAFHRAEAWLTGSFADLEILSPARDVEIYTHPESNREEGIDTEAAHGEYLRRDIQHLLRADGIVLIDGWERSKGANFELTVARALNLRVLVLTEEADDFHLEESSITPFLSVLNRMMLERAKFRNS